MEVLLSQGGTQQCSSPVGVLSQLGAPRVSVEEGLLFQLAQKVITRSSL